MTVNGSGCIPIEGHIASLSSSVGIYLWLKPLESQRTREALYILHKSPGAECTVEKGSVERRFSENGEYPNTTWHHLIFKIFIFFFVFNFLNLKIKHR